MSRSKQHVAIEVRAAGPKSWEDVVTVFGTRGAPSWCWCQYFVTTGSSYEESATHNRSALREQLRSRPPTGLLAYRGESPVGWVQVGPVARYPRVTEHRKRRSVVGDDPPGIWRITCFVVPPAYRRHGVATALLTGAVDHARTHDARTLEAHPVDTEGGRKPGSDLYHGVLSTFLAAGFVEIGRTAPQRPIVRLDL